MFYDAKTMWEMGYNLFSLQPQSKRPDGEWKLQQRVRLTLGELAVKFGHLSRNNVGMICDNVVVVDFDTGLTKAREWYTKHRGILKTITLTRRGIHAWFSPSGEEWSGKHADGELRAQGKGYVVVPPSIVKHDDGEFWNYSFVDGHGLVPPAELPPFRAEYVDRYEKANGTTLVRDDIRDVRRYIRGIFAIQGQYGSNATIKVAARLRDAGFSEAEALAEMIEWNRTNAQPEWSIPEMAKKVKDAYRKV